MTDELDQTDQWLSPAQVSKEFNVVQRRVYRWVERKQVLAQRTGDKLRVSRASVEELLTQEKLRHLVSEVIDVETPPAELKEGVTGSLARSDRERAALYQKVAEDARVIGELTEKTRHLDTLEIEVTTLRQRVERLIQYRVLFWVTLLLFVVAIIIFSVLLWFAL